MQLKKFRLQYQMYGQRLVIQGGYSADIDHLIPAECDH